MVKKNNNVKKRKPRVGRRKRFVAPAITGSGAYRFKAARDFGRVGRFIGGTVMGGGPIGGAVGGWAGQGFGKAFRKITGYGDYSVMENSLVNPSSRVPTFEGDNQIRVRHKEFIGNVSSSTAFSLLSYSINPGNQRTFPWLSGISEAYEKYHVNGLIMYFRSTSATALNSTDTALGKIVIAADYNPADADFVTTEQMYSSPFTNSGPPSQDLIVALECSRKNMPTNSLFIRTGGLPSGQDVRLYDHAKMEIATEGSQAASQIGELWVSYDITLFSPVQNALIGSNVKSAHWRLASSVVTTGYFGATRTEKHNHIDGLTVNGTTIAFPPKMGSGTYMIHYSCTGASTNISSTPTITRTNCVAVNCFTADNVSGIGTVAGETTVNYTTTFVVKITSQDATIVLSAGVLPATPTWGDLYIMQINDAPNHY